MNLVIDIGNSLTKYALFKKSRLFKKFSVSDISRIGSLAGKRNTIDRVIICSTVPKNNQKAIKLIQSKFKIHPLVIGKNCKLEIKSKYTNKKSLGDDRLVNLYGAACLYEAPLIVVSLGSAVTIDYLDKRFIHQGGFIFPGLRLSAESLSKQTAQLPLIKPQFSSQKIGTSTHSCINLGVQYGIASSIDGICTHLSSHFRSKPLVLACGGDAKSIKRYSKCIQKADENHALKSLNLILNSH